MSQFDDESDEDGDEEWRDEAACRFSEAMQNLVNYHIEEYNLSHASLIGVMVIHVLRRGIEAIYGPDEDDEDEDQSDP